MPEISIIICTYNPDREIFSRCLAAVRGLELKGIGTEIIIVDNNSSPPISRRSEFDELIASLPNSRVVVESKQGLTNARRRGISESTAPVIIFFDDDNEPDPDYLVEAVEFMSLNPSVGVAGPGRVRVQYMGQVPSWLTKPWCKFYFQELDLPETLMHSNEAPNPACSPYGTGMILRRKSAEPYCDLIDAGTVRTSDRSGGSLMGAGDVQIVWLAVKKGWTVAQVKGIALNHLISNNKANFRYLTRLAYGGGLSWLNARYEIHPEEREDDFRISQHLAGLFKRFSKQALYNVIKPREVFVIFAGHLGIAESIYLEGKKPSPLPLSFLVRILGLR